jgi:hypothetical protein
MERNRIKSILRESLGFVSEDEEGNDSQKRRNTKRDYTDIQNALNKDHNPTAPSHVGVMKDALAWDDDESGTNRSLFGKMVHQDTNDEGSYYQFDEKQLARVRASLHLN